MANNKIDMPWSIKGVSSEARTLAKAAAAREGVTMGEWVSQAIRRRSQPIASEATDAVHFAATQHIKPYSKGAAEKALAISAVLSSASNSLDWLGQALRWVRDENPHNGESAEDYQCRCNEAVSLAVTGGDMCDKKRPKVHHLAPHDEDMYRARTRFERSLAHQQWEDRRK